MNQNSDLSISWVSPAQQFDQAAAVAGERPALAATAADRGPAARGMAADAAATPCSATAGITGAQITRDPSGPLAKRGRVSARVDWVSFTVPASYGLPGARVLLQRLGVRDVVLSGHGWQFYEHLAFGVNGVRVAWGRKDQFGVDVVHVDIPGRHCNTLSRRQIVGLFRTIKEKGGHLTRLDLALDDHDRVTSIPEALAAIQAGDVATRAKDFSLQGNGKVGQNTCTGMGFYLGRPSSDTRLCVYDKTLERQYRAEDLEAVDAFNKWADAGVRWELRLRDERATACAEMLSAVPSESWGECFAGVLAGFADFRDRGAASNISRAPRLNWWGVFLGGAKLARLRIEKPAESIGKVLAWLDRSVSANLATAYSYWAKRGYDPLEKVMELVCIGGEKLRPRHEALLLGVG